MCHFVEGSQGTKKWRNLPISQGEKEVEINISHKSLILFLLGNATFIKYKYNSIYGIIYTQEVLLDCKREILPIKHAIL